MKKLLFSSILLISVSVNAEVGGVTVYSGGNKPKTSAPKVRVPAPGDLTTEQQHALQSAYDVLNKCLDDIATKYGYIKEKQAYEAADKAYFALFRSNVPKGEFSKSVDEITTITKPLDKQLSDYRKQLKKLSKKDDKSEKEKLTKKIDKLGKKIGDVWKTHLAEFRKKYKLEEAYQKQQEALHAYFAKEQLHPKEADSCYNAFDKVGESIEPSIK